LDFLIFISTKIKDSLLENKILDSITSQIGGISMDFDLNFKIPEYNGCLLKIKSNEIRKKRDATQHLLEFIVKHNLDHPNDQKKKGEKIAIIIKTITTSIIPIIFFFIIPPIISITHKL